MWSYLTGVANEIEADIIIGLLQQEKIPVQKKYPGSGNLKASYGITNGVEIWVESFYLKQAQEIFNSRSIDFDEESLPDEEENVAKTPPARQSVNKAVLLGFILVLFIFLYWTVKELRVY